ncbi:hypothetical protein G7Y89_g7100 [Cudoniella acicularis]|uniref:Azaphilone pigments biosynthesis cluster protein L N-terminal domain-containing protein n=1 Tax=Cudoniella acicularis TaxID=354080 RepID=A0A8H4W295_9HELO|nr:hypothetical protein G7Y89_g7100 [Cudoniella acicularis]
MAISMASLAAFAPLTLLVQFGTRSDITLLCLFAIYRKQAFLLGLIEKHVDFVFVGNVFRALATLFALLQIARFAVSLQVSPPVSNDFPAKPMLFPCRTSHIRLIPTKHSFDYSYLWAGIPIGWTGSSGGMLSSDIVDLPWYKRWFTLMPRAGWWHVNGDYYLGRGHVEGGMQGKLWQYFEQQGIDRNEYPYAYVFTAARFFDYHSNPVSVWNLYSPSKELSAILLEVNNTFEERHMYFMKPSSTPLLDDLTIKPPRFSGKFKKELYVSTFNSRSGSYSVSTSDALFPHLTTASQLPINTTIGLSSSTGHPKLIARIFSVGPAVDPSTMSFIDKVAFLWKWWWVGFLTIPRTLMQAWTLFFEKKVKWAFRPEPRKDTMPRPATDNQIFIEGLFRRYLRYIVSNATEALKIRYTTAGIHPVETEIMTSSTCTSSTKEMEVRILTALFYSRFLYYTSPSQALLGESQKGNQTLSLSDLNLVSAISSASTSITPLNEAISTWQSLAFTVLSTISIPVPAIENCETETRPHSPKAVPSAPLFTPTNEAEIKIQSFLRSEMCTSAERKEYLSQAARLFLTHHIAFGSEDLLDLSFFLWKASISWGASVIAVISLAFQLADCVKELHEFWASVREAPSDLQPIVDDLKLLSTVLSEMAAQSSRNHSNSTMDDVLKVCMRQIEELQAITNELEKGFTSARMRTRIWSAIKAKFKEEKIEKFRLALINFKTTLLLAHQAAFHQSTNESFDNQQQAILSMTQLMGRMELERCSQTVTVPIDSGTAGLAAVLEREINRMISKEENPIIRSGFQMAMSTAIQKLLSENQAENIHNNPATKNVGFSGRFTSQVSKLGLSGKKRRRHKILSHQSDTEINIILGTIHFSSQTFQILSEEEETYPDSDIRQETEIAFRFHPAPWIVTLGFVYGLSSYAFRSDQTWKHVVKTFRPVTDDSLIFGFCKAENIDGVKHLLSERIATPWDTNSTGWTPLHIAAQSVNPELCKLLLNAGAHRSARPYKYTYSCLSLASEKDSNYSTVKTIDTLRLFLDEADDLHDIFGDGWTTLSSLIEVELDGTQTFDEHKSPFAWMIKILQSNIQAIIDLPHEGSMFSLLDSIIISGNLELFQFILNTFSSLVDCRLGEEHNTLLVECLHCRQYAMARFLIQRGANLHAEGCHYESSESVWTCPTSYALVSSASFFEWRELLKVQGVDLEEFITTAISQTSLRVEGWQKDTLQKLFDLDFEPTPQPALHKCPNFHSLDTWSDAVVELSW